MALYSEMIPGLISFDIFVPKHLQCAKGPPRAVLLKLSDVMTGSFVFQCARDWQAKEASPLLLFLSFLENIPIPADDGKRIVTGTHTTL